MTLASSGLLVRTLHCATIATLKSKLALAISIADNTMDIHLNIDVDLS